MKQPWEMTPQERDVYFEILEKELAQMPLPTAHSGKRTAQAHEFMMMHCNEDNIGFKHSFTRNYVFLERRKPSMLGSGEWRLTVPLSRDAFLRGEFDECPKFER